jgi:hypothetical protein
MIIIGSKGTVLTKTMLHCTLRKTKSSNVTRLIIWKYEHGAVVLTMDKTQICTR